MTTVEDARWAMEVNYWGTFQMTQRFLPLLRQSQGRIILVGSIGR